MQDVLRNAVNPYRDVDLEAGIVIHELPHGLSIHFDWWPRELWMSGCLEWGVSDVMGEGRRGE